MNNKYNLYIDAYKEVIEQGIFNKLKANVKDMFNLKTIGGKAKENAKNKTLTEFINKYNLKLSKDTNGSIQKNTYEKQVKGNYIFRLKIVDGKDTSGNSTGKHRYSILNCQLLENSDKQKKLAEENIKFKYSWPLKELEEDLKNFLLKEKLLLSDLKIGKNSDVTSYADLDIGDIGHNKQQKKQQLRQELKNNSAEKERSQQQEKNSSSTKKQSIAATRRKLNKIFAKLSPEQQQFLKNSKN